jgi:hypothetical protein
MQHGLNTILPGTYANTNLCQARHDYSEYDFLSHGGGSFGYSGRLWEAPRADFARYRAAVQRFKAYRRLLLGDFARPLGNPQTRYDLAVVTWADDSGSITMSFNDDGPRSASIDLS